VHGTYNTTISFSAIHSTKDGKNEKKYNIKLESVYHQKNRIPFYHGDILSFYFIQY